MQNWCNSSACALELHRFSTNPSLIQMHFFMVLAHWGWVTRICVGELTIIGSDNGLSPGPHQTIIWTSARIWLIWPLGTNFSKISIIMIMVKTLLCVTPGQHYLACRVVSDEKTSPLWSIMILCIGGSVHYEVIKYLGHNSCFLATLAVSHSLKLDDLI